MSEYKVVQSVVQKVIKLKRGKEYEKALRVLLEALEQFPDNNFLKTSLADLYIRMNRLFEAEELVDQVLDFDPENDSALSVKGNIAYIKRGYKKAAEYFKEAYRLKDSNYLAGRLVRTYINLDELETALNICQEKLRQEDADKRFKKLEAEIYRKMNKYDKAEEIMEEYLTEIQDDHFAFKEKIQMKLKGRPPAVAVQELEQLLKINRYSENIHLHTLLAEKLQEIEEFDKAVEIYKKILLLAPEDLYIIKSLGMTLYKKGNLKEALSYLQKAFKIDPNDYYIRSTLEYIYKSLKMEKEGTVFFQEIIKTTGLNNLWGIVKRLAKEVEEDEEDRGTN